MEMKLKKPQRFRKARSGILVQTTILVVILFFVFSGLSYHFFRKSLNRLIENSKDKFIEKRVELLYSGYDFLQEVILEIQSLSGITASLAEASQEFLSAIPGKEISPIQKIDNDLLKTMADNNYSGISLLLVGIPEVQGMTSEPLVILASDEDIVYQEVPSSLVSLMEESESLRYVYLEDGVPELGLEGEYLVTMKLENVAGGLSFGIFSFTSMHDEMAAINDFFDKGRRSAVLQVLLVAILSIAALILITFVVLNFLLRRRITDPIDELAATAESVMEGFLDVQVPVRRGEEFEGLKVAFNEMINSLRNMLSKRLED